METDLQKAPAVICCLVNSFQVLTSVSIYNERISKMYRFDLKFFVLNTLFRVIIGYDSNTSKLNSRPISIVRTRKKICMEIDAVGSHAHVSKIRLPLIGNLLRKKNVATGNIVDPSFDTSIITKCMFFDTNR